MNIELDAFRPKLQERGVRLKEFSHSGYAIDSSIQYGATPTFRQQMMIHQMEFEIHYQFNGEPRSFLHQTRQLCQNDALHCATLHAGVGTVSGNISAGPLRIATLQAESLGITQVRWKRSTLEY
ncbi:hypothetical protein ALP45_00615 [Pseudomonas coronafaciens pv. atropurpurea]|nr:hypothetical protein ALP45_00615 [Pseudomonas coronafaciens pv. atropurpurea]